MTVRIVVYGLLRRGARMSKLASPAVLDLLDEAERVDADPPLYRRVLVETDGAPAWLYVYAGPVDPSTWITSGDWLRR